MITRNDHEDPELARDAIAHPDPRIALPRGEPRVVEATFERDGRSAPAPASCDSRSGRARASRCRPRRPRRRGAPGRQRSSVPSSDPVTTPTTRQSPSTPPISRCTRPSHRHLGLVAHDVGVHHDRVGVVRVEPPPCTMRRRHERRVARQADHVERLVHRCRPRA